MARAALVAAVAAGCGPPPPGIAVGFDEFCTPRFDAPASAEPGKLVRVAVQGWVLAPREVTVCPELCPFELAESPDGSGRTLRYSVRLGDDANRLAPLPERFKPEDFRLRTQNGEIVGIGDAVRLHGGRAGLAERRDCELHVDRIETP